MDVLKNKQTKSYNYTSRYATFPFYYNEEDKKYIYGLTAQLNNNSIYVLHKITQEDSLESLAYKYYGRPDYYWIIADYNRIQDPYIKLWPNVESLKIPSLSNITFGE